MSLKLPVLNSKNMKRRGKKISLPCRYWGSKTKCDEIFQSHRSVDRTVQFLSEFYGSLRGTQSQPLRNTAFAATGAQCLALSRVSATRTRRGKTQPAVPAGGTKRISRALEHQHSCRISLKSGLCFNGQMGIQGWAGMTGSVKPRWGLGGRKRPCQQGRPRLPNAHRPSLPAHFLPAGSAASTAHSPQPAAQPRSPPPHCGGRGTLENKLGR